MRYWQMSDQVTITLVSAPVDRANDLADALVEERLVACVNIIPAVRSVYRWRGKIEHESESLLIIKSTETHGEKIIERVKQLHSADCPEIISWNVSGGSRDYLNWVKAETTDSETSE